MKSETLELMKHMLEVQGWPGNWDYDPYMHGMYNGMEYILSSLEGREPQFKTAPEVWGIDKEVQFNEVKTQEGEV